MPVRKMEIERKKKRNVYICISREGKEKEREKGEKEVSL